MVRAVEAEIVAAALSTTERTERTEAPTVSLRDLRVLCGEILQW
jgi:hypothetical protein